MKNENENQPTRPNYSIFLIWLREKENRKKERNVIDFTIEVLKIINSSTYHLLTVLKKYKNLFYVSFCFFYIQLNKIRRRIFYLNNI